MRSLREPARREERERRIFIGESGDVPLVCRTLRLLRAAPRLAPPPALGGAASALRPCQAARPGLGRRSCSCGPSGHSLKGCPALKRSPQVAENFWRGGVPY